MWNSFYFGNNNVHRLFEQLEFTPVKMDKAGVYSGQNIVYWSSWSLLRSNAALWIFSKQLPDVFQTLEKHFPSFVNFPTFHTLCWSKFSARNAFTSQEFSIFQWFQIIWDFFVRTHVKNKYDVYFKSSGNSLPACDLAWQYPSSSMSTPIIIIATVIIIESGASAGTVSLFCHHRSWRKRRNCVIIVSSSKLAQAPELCHYFVIIKAGASAGTSVDVSQWCQARSHQHSSFTPGKSGDRRTVILLCVRFSLTYIRRCDVILFLYASA